MTAHAHDSADDLAEAISEAAQKAELIDTKDENIVDRWINGFVEFLGVSVLVAITLLVFANASLRYISNSGIIWADEVVIALVPWLALLGMFLSVRRREIIRISFLIDSLSPRNSRIVLAVTELLSAFAFGYLTIKAFDYVSLFGSDRLVYLSIQKGWFTAAMCVGAAIVSLAFFAEAISHFRNRNLDNGVARGQQVGPGEKR